MAEQSVTNSTQPGGLQNGTVQNPVQVQPGDANLSSAVAQDLRQAKIAADLAAVLLHGGEALNFKFPANIVGMPMLAGVTALPVGQFELKQTGAGSYSLDNDDLGLKATFKDGDVLKIDQIPNGNFEDAKQIVLVALGTLADWYYPDELDAKRQQP